MVEIIYTILQYCCLANHYLVNLISSLFVYSDIINICKYLANLIFSQFDTYDFIIISLIWYDHYFVNLILSLLGKFNIIIILLILYYDWLIWYLYCILQAFKLLKLKKIKWLYSSDFLCLCRKSLNLTFSVFKVFRFFVVFLKCQEEMVNDAIQSKL